MEEPPQTASVGLKFALENFPRRQKLKPVLDDTEEIVERWFDCRTINGWLTKHKNPIKNWQSDLILFAENWAKKVRSDKSKQPKENYLAKLN